MGINIDWSAISAFIFGHPELIALGIALFLSWGVSLWSERVFLNETLSKTMAQRASMVITSTSCLILGQLLWPVFDSSEKPAIRLAVNLGVAMWSPFLYILVTKFLGQKFPWLASVFTPDSPPPPPPTPPAA